MREKNLSEPIPPEAVPKGFAPGVQLEDTDRIRQPFLDLLRLKQLKEEQEDQLKETNKAVMDKQMECVLLLEQYGLQNARLKDVGLVYISLKDHVSVPADKKELLMDELRERGFDAIIKTEPTVHNASLGALVKELREGGEKPLGTVTVYTEKKIVVRK